MDRVAGENALKYSCRTKPFLALRRLNWFSAALWFIVCFKSTLRLHYIPLCLLENHYGAIKSTVLSQMNMAFSSVSDCCTRPSCLLRSSVFVMVKRYSCRENTQQMAVAGWCFILFWMLSDTQAQDFSKCWWATDSCQATCVWHVQWPKSSSSKNEKKLRCPYEMNCALLY